MKIFDKKNKKMKSNKSLIPFRLNLLFFIVFLLFAALVGQLAYLQIVYGGKFQSEVERTDKTTITAGVPRGIVYDAKGRIIVGNEAKKAITYTKSAGVSNTDMYKIAKRLSKLITINTDKLSDRDKAEFYLADPVKYKKIYDNLPKNLKYKNNELLDDSTISRNMTSYVTKKNFALSDKDLIAAAIYKKMNSSYQLSTAFIKNSDVTEDEVARIGEHLTSLPGIRLGTDWSREYPEGDFIKGIVGSVSTEEQGLPQNQITELLAKGYSRNERVGTSYLEKSYESVLSGTKSQTQIELNSNNQIVSSKTLYAGSRGSNLTLTIDSKYQKAVEKILANTYASAAGITQYSDGAYAVAMNPNTGAILAMAGINNNPRTGEQTSDALGVINRTFVMGSAVKGATVLGAMMDGVITPSNNVLPDEPVYLPGTPVKKSVYPIGTYGSLDAATALEVSSNDYMMKLAMKEGHAKYIPNQYISADQNLFSKMRGYYNQFGLGVKTGIDLPGEASGIEGASLNDEGLMKVGSALDLSYGNYDAYTLIQMAQYVSTIANGGYRMKPYIVQSINDTLKNGDANSVAYSNSPTVLNKVGVTPSQLDVVKQGFYQVTHGTLGWTTAKQLANVSPSISGKTGTAQSFYYNPDDPTNTDPPETVTTSFVGYAPSSKPQIAIAVVFPNLSSEKGNYNITAAQQMMEQYFAIEQNKK